MLKCRYGSLNKKFFIKLCKVNKNKFNVEYSVGVAGYEENSENTILKSIDITVEKNSNNKYVIVSVN